VSVEASSIPSNPQWKKPDDQTCCDGVVKHTIPPALLLLLLLIKVADLEGAEPAPPPPPLGDGLTPSLTVMLANAKF